MLFEKRAKILRRKIDKISQLIERKLVAEVLIDIVDNRLNLIELLAVLAAVSEVHHPVQLDKELIKVSRGLVTAVIIIGFHLIKGLLEN